MNVLGGFVFKSRRNGRKFFCRRTYVLKNSQIYLTFHWCYLVVKNWYQMLVLKYKLFVYQKALNRIFHTTFLTTQFVNSKH